MWKCGVNINNNPSIEIIVNLRLLVNFGGPKKQPASS